jgi:hypothetical protein
MVQIVTCRDRTIARSIGRLACAAVPVLGLAACQILPDSAVGNGAPFVLTSSGGYVLSDAPPGIEVSLGSKLLRRADEPIASNPSSQRIAKGGEM